jgi:flagella basal body P-ring formation protein FlgA
MAAFAATPEDPSIVAAAVKQAALAIAPPNSNIVLGTTSGVQYMQACQGPLAVLISGQAPYEQAAVHCPSPAWVLYLTVNIAQSQMVAVAAGPIAAGQAINPTDITLKEEPVSLFAGRHVYFDASQIIGANATMSLQKGTIISSDDISEPVMVTAGQTVTVEVISGGVEVSIDAVAGETGRIGDTVLFTNPSSGRRFSALITADGPVVKLQS